MASGGTRAGAGRPAGSQNADTAAMRAALSMLLEGQVHIAVAALADIAKSGTSIGGLCYTRSNARTATRGPWRSPIARTSRRSVRRLHR